MATMSDESSAGPSAWERQLYTHLSEHVETEESMLTEYSDLARDGGSRALEYLIELLVDDESRHHRLFRQLAESLETEALMKRQAPAIPYLDFQMVRAPLLVQEGAHALLDREEDDARELKRLKRELRDVKDTSLWSLLVELMQRDTQNHIAILSFVLRHIRREPPEVPSDH